MEIDYSKQHWDKGACPKVDCRKNSCKCGLKKVFLASALGDDSKDSPIAPKNGDYCNSIVEYEANGNVYIYSAEGIPTLVETVDQTLGTMETYTVATSDWTTLSASSPYTYQADVTATYTIGANTIVELLNNDPVLFANYGFAIGSVSNQTVTLYAIGQPSANVTLKINYKG